MPPIPCGTKPPPCHKPCSRAHDCDHEVLHLCHSYPTCPPCGVLTAKHCHGKHEVGLTWLSIHREEKLLKGFCAWRSLLHWRFLLTRTAEILRLIEILSCRLTNQNRDGFTKSNKFEHRFLSCSLQLCSEGSIIITLLIIIFLTLF